MSRIDSINSERIKWCCKDRGISPQDLAVELGFAWDRFNKVLLQNGGLTFVQLQKLANFFGRNILFFLESGPVTAEQVHTPQFRTIANQKPTISTKIRALIERVERQREVYISLREGLEGEEEVIFSPPKLVGKPVALAANIARKWLGLSDANDFTSYRQAVEEKGILIFRSNGYSGPWQIPKDDPICGFSLFDSRCPVIVVKKLTFEPRQVFTLMHELGHILLHRKSYIDDEADLTSHEGKERQANAFAGLLLVPDRYLSLVRDSSRPKDVSDYDHWLRRLTQKWGVSAEVILRRLKDTKRLSELEYNRYREWKKKQKKPSPDNGSRLYRHREPRHVFGEPFVSTVLDALHAKQITLAKASTYLDNLKIADVHKLEAFSAGI